jgi:hypothetical protein
VVEEVAKFVENGLDLTVSEQRGLIADSGRQVAADEA